MVGTVPTQMSILEMLMYLDLDPTPFSDRVFSRMDTDGSGSINFLEFVVAYWGFCSLTKQGVCQFAFYLYSELESHPRVLGAFEIETLISHVFGKGWERESHATSALNQLMVRAVLLPLSICPCATLAAGPSSLLLVWW